MTANDLLDLAFHEAAHAVAAFTLGFDLEDARIDEDGRRGITTVLQRPRTVEDAEASVCWTLAPRAFEHELGRRRRPSATWYLPAGRWPCLPGGRAGERTDG